MPNIDKQAALNQIQHVLERDKQLADQADKMFNDKAGTAEREMLFNAIVVGSTFATKSFPSVS